MSEKFKSTKEIAKTVEAPKGIYEHPDCFGWCGSYCKVLKEHICKFKECKFYKTEAEYIKGIVESELAGYKPKGEHNGD